MADDRLRPEGRKGERLPRRADLVYRYLLRHNALFIEDISEGTGLSIGQVTSELAWLVAHDLAEHKGGGSYRAL